MFADDIKIYTVEPSTAYSYDSTLLQQDLDKLSELAQKWLLTFNVPKCVVLPLDNSRTTNYTMTDGSDIHTDMSGASIPN